MARGKRKHRSVWHRTQGIDLVGALPTYFRRRAKRLGRRLRGIRRAVWLPVAGLLVVGLALALNFAYQVVRKPSELFFPISESFYKDPAKTWAAYGPLFERHSTSIMTPALLAALAQVEGSGNPIVRTDWRFRPARQPFDIFRPASSAVGMYQITDGNFALARRYCIHDHKVVEQGPWYAWRSCWFNALYTRTVPSHAIEMTAAFLERNVSEALAREKLRASLAQKQTLAALMHLCGPRAAAQLVREGFMVRADQTCGAHDARDYVQKVQKLTDQFVRLAAAQ